MHRSGDQAQADHSRRRRALNDDPAPATTIPTANGAPAARRRSASSRATNSRARFRSDHAGQQAARQRQEGLRPHRFPERAVGASSRRVDQAGLQELTALDTPVSGVLEQDIFYVNQIMKFGKFFAVFQSHPERRQKDRGHRLHGARDQGQRARQEARVREDAGDAQSGAGASADGKVVVQFR